MTGDKIKASFLNLSLVTRRLSLFFCCVLDSFYDVLVAGAATQVSFEAVTNLFLRGMRIALDQLRGGHNHSGRAVAALQAVTLPETFLHGMQVAVAG